MQEKFISAQDQEVYMAYLAQLFALQSGDLAALDAMLDENFTLTHISGYQQPKNEWLGAIGAGKAQYHQMAEHHTSISSNRSNASVIGQVTVDASFDGERGQWNVEFSIDYTQRSGRWIAMRSVGGTW